MDEPLNLVLFSGTDDKLQAAAVLTAGAAALGRPVHIFLQYWALHAFRPHPIAAAPGPPPTAARGSFCPGPLMELIRAIREGQVGDVIAVRSSDRGSKVDIPKWIEKAGHRLISV